MANLSALGYVFDVTVEVIYYSLVPPCSTLLDIRQLSFGEIDTNAMKKMNKIKKMKLVCERSNRQRIKV